MTVFLVFVFLFFLGSLCGWIMELLYSRIILKKWVNPGFFVGPWVPIYGFGLCISSFIYIIFYKYNPFMVILLIGFTMTIIELIAGLIFLKFDIRLWDYSDYFCNYKGVICLLFSLIWVICAAVFYCFFAPQVINLIKWFSNNLSFSMILGIFIGFFILDFIYSFNILIKIKNYARDNHVQIKYEEFKKHIKERQEKRKEKYSFIFAFKQNRNLDEYLKSYKKNKKS